MAADLGLDPSGRLGSAYLVPYGQECQLIPGYRGLIDLAVRSGFVRSVNAWVVHEKDGFSAVAGKLPRHVPWLPRAGEDMDPGPVFAAWARYRTREGGDESVVMSLRELWAVRDRSAGYRSAMKYGNKDNPWLSDPEEMLKKTVIRRALKLAPLNPTGALNEALEKYAKALEHDDIVDAEVVAAPAAPAAPAVAENSKSNRLKDDLK
jgi:recombination protein RecT